MRKLFKCPFCGKPSAVSFDEQFFCFSCGMGGDRTACVRAMKNITYKEAAEKRGIKLLPVQDQKEKKKKVLQALAEAEKYYYSSVALRKVNYFKKRKLETQTVKTFKLGYSDTNKPLHKFLLKKGIDKETLLAAGLICVDQETGDVYDKFWKRIMFPIHDEIGNTIGFGGRVLGDEKPKYLNSSDSIVFDKSHNLYALDIAKKSDKDFFLLAEGYIDVISLHQSGFDSAVASLGTAFTLGQADLMLKYKNKVYVVPDGDLPGQNAAEKTVNLLLKKGFDVKVISVAPYKDVDELLTAEGPEVFEQRLTQAINGKAFLIKGKSAEEIAAFLFANC